MRVLEAAEVGPWVREVLLDPKRRQPVVAVTSRQGTEGTWIDPRRLDEAIGGVAEVVCLETGDATWELADALPPRLDVYGGAVRTWWPGLEVTSSPHDHRLYFVHSPAQADAVFEQIVTAVQEYGKEAARERAAVVNATVTRIDGPRVELDAGGHTGWLRYADLPLELLAANLSVGMGLPVRAVRQRADSSWEFSVQELLPSPWDRVLTELEVDDVVPARVQNVTDYGAFLEILPGVIGLVHISEVDWGYVRAVSEFAREGQVLAVKILTIDPESRRMELSIKRALGTDPQPLPSLLPEGSPFQWGVLQETAPEAEETGELEERIESLSDELEAATGDRRQLAEQNKALREQARDLRKKLKSAEGRLEAAGRRDASEDPLSSERAFLQGVRLAYARLLDEDDRMQHPLCRMRVGASFLDSLRGLEGIEVDKVLEVCAQVACEKAHEIPAREVHQLRSGPGGSPSRVRSSDQAQAWRCALQVNTPSARRLHWWRIPGAEGPTVEFACVGVHDDYGIPE